MTEASSSRTVKVAEKNEDNSLLTGIFKDSVNGEYLIIGGFIFFNEFVIGGL